MAVALYFQKDFKNGFTLIELVIIMVILGVLAAVAIPRIGNTIDSSEVSAEEAVIGSLRSALEVYAMDQVVMNSNKSYPPNPFDALDERNIESAGKLPPPDGVLLQPSNKKNLNLD